MPVQGASIADVPGFTSLRPFLSYRLNENLLCCTKIHISVSHWSFPNTEVIIRSRYPLSPGHIDPCREFAYQNYFKTTHKDPSTAKTEHVLVIKTDTALSLLSFIFTKIEPCQFYWASRVCRTLIWEDLELCGPNLREASPPEPSACCLVAPWSKDFLCFVDFVSVPFEISKLSLRASSYTGFHPRKLTCLCLQL